MAERRMFAKTIIDSDAFLDMPLSAQALYFHLGMRADDDGFVNAPKKIQRIVGAGDDDAKILIAKNFIIPFNSGVIVIKHWRIHNTIQRDRYKATTYQDEFAQLSVKQNKAYTLGAEQDCIQDVYRTESKRNQDGIGTESQNSIDKIRLDKDREVEGAAASPYTGENALRRPVFDLADGSAYAPSDEKVAEWIKAFPQLDVEKCLREAAAKNNAHSGQDMRRRKNAMTVEPYIVNWLIVESGQAEKAAKERRRNGFSDMPEHAPTDSRELRKELSERNGNLI